jgi:hypothetical protein
VTFALSGASSPKPTRFAPIWTDTFFSGLVTQRNPLRGNQSHLVQRYYPTYDALIDGSNVEISNRLTPIRRPGNSVYNSATWTNVDAFYNFNLFNANTEQIKVIVDTSTAIYNGTGPSTQSLIFTKSAGAGQAFFQSVGNELFFGDGVDQKKWVQTLVNWTASTSYSVANLQTFIIDTNGNIQQLTSAIVPISNVQVASNVLTITTSSATNLTTVLSSGLSVTFSGLTTNTFLNGQTVTILTVTASTFTASFTHANVNTADTGIGTVVAGGSPVTGSSQPAWSSTNLATTNDNTAQWTCRGNPVENWGIAAPTTAPTVAVQSGNNVSWQPNTFYSNDQVVVDSNNNLQQVTTAGTSGATTPTWATTDGSTTTDGGVTWTQKETAAELTWAASTAYTAAKPFLVASAGGKNCLFKLQANTYPVFKQVAGAYVTVNFYMHNSAFAGQCELRNPTDGTNNPGAGSYPQLATANGTSILFNPPQNNGQTDPLLQPIQWATLSAAGNITGYTTPWSGANTNYTMIVTTTITVPAAGQYTFTINHDDGMFWGIGPSGANQPTSISGPNNCPAPVATLTALNGYNVMGANNVSGYNTDTYVVNFPAAGDYPVEIDYAQWQTRQSLCFYCNGQTPVPGTAQTGTTQPIWPAWTTSFAPAYPSVNERNNSNPAGGSGNGPIVWNNLGPTADYSWHAKTQFLTTANSTIIDPNSNTEDPYEAGVTGTTKPTFATGINQLTSDNPNLTWINQGPASAPPAGSISTFSTQGWIYYVALVNTLTNTVSNLGLASVKTGPFIGATGIKVSGGLPSTIDPQADYVAVFRTQDGGAIPYLIPGTGNTVYTVPLGTYQSSGYVDTTLDSGLNILLPGAQNGQNTPPGVGAIIPAYHLNRIFFAIGNTVYWTSGPNTPIGNGFEGVAPTNNATFPSLVRRLVPTSTGLFVYTVSDIYLITGNGTAQSPLFPIPYLPGKGVNSYNAVAINGSLTYIFSTANSLMAIDPNGGYYDLGFPIGDQFIKSNWNAANVYLAWHEYGEDVALYVCDGSTGWFRGNPTPSPESGQTWSPFATIVGGVKAIASIETTPGVKKMLVGPTGSGPILARDLTTNADNSTAYKAFFTIGSLVLAQPGQIAEVAFITTDSVAVGTRPSLSVLMDETSGTFDPLTDVKDDPPQLAPSQSVYANRYSMLSAQNGTPALCRHMQIRLDWPSENQPNELLSMTLYGGYAAES